MSNNLGFDVNKLMSSSATVQIPDDKVQVIEEPKKKRGRPRKSEQQPKEEVVDQLPYCQSSQPYEDSYNETNNMLRGSIMQIDMLSNDVQAEIENIRKSKTIKGKYKKRKLVYIIEIILKSVYMFIILFFAKDIELWNMDNKFYILGACIFIYYCLWIKFFVGGFSFRRKRRNLFSG